MFLTQLDLSLFANPWVRLVLVAALVIVALVVFWRVRRAIVRFPHFASTEPAENEALKALTERYEAGEIDQRTYRRMRRDLEQG